MMSLIKEQDEENKKYFYYSLKVFENIKEPNIAM